MAQVPMDGGFGFSLESAANEAIEAACRLLDETEKDLTQIVAHLRALEIGPNRLHESIALKLAEDALARIKAETQS